MSQKRVRQQQKRKNDNKGKIESHKKEGSTLISPFNQIPNTSFMSWMNDRLPCMIWAGLLIKGIGREQAIEIFRSIGFHVGNLFREGEGRHCNLPRVGIYGLSTLDEDLQDKFFEILFSTKDAAVALKPLVLFNELPLFDKWAKHIENISDDQEALWTTLADTVATLLDHQSQESTDCRWAYMIPIANSGKFHLQDEMQFRTFTEYPYYEDQRMARPFIRSTEMQFGGGIMNDSYVKGKRLWSEAFWKECKSKTQCLSVEPAMNSIDFNLVQTISSVREIWNDLSIHFIATDEFTHVQPKRDASFGFCFYALTVTQEGLASSGKLLTAKLALRMLAEIYITFKYLISVRDEKLWDIYRSYGSGQAKLTFLKLDEVLKDQPGYLKKENIEALANEDIYMDFQNINLGNWAKTDLRAMSQVAGCKDVYDTYYSWPSSYAHGQWCAVRDVVFTTCHNPLHRLHRIPRTAPRYEDGAENDLILLLNKVLDLLDDVYPSFKRRSKLVQNEKS
ncbi:DUF5677 domain-containing protein [Aeromonas dhakensis]|uniref:DUF5677 domain-containing protein n=1 Tax=Aeromonas dhakensis TaxID=196024 RepID=UPI000B12D341|nr:DUF5677 domain-containing protein [Aeromonas dhakensis]